jgi:NADPH2:quinone reductase
MRSRQLFSTATDHGTVEVGLVEVTVAHPGDHEVVVRVEAAPVNPSDLGQLFGPADLGTVRPAGDGQIGVVADVPEVARSMLAPRLGIPMPVGAEGAGVIVAAGSSAAAQALVGRTVAALGGGMYTEYRVLGADQCLVMPEGVTPAQAASCFVNPLTALGMIDTMRLDGHHALVHTAAASSLGQMLVKLCIADGVPLVNVVRRPEQVELLRTLGASVVCDTSDAGFTSGLTDALVETDATIAFDAVGGGTLAGDILTAMEVAQSRKGAAIRGYGSTVHKQVYVYGGLDRSPIQLSRRFGPAWSVGGWLLPLFLDRVGPERAQALRDRVANEVTTTFATSYTAVVSFEEMLSVDMVARYSRLATGEKYLVDPTRDGR